MKGVKIWKIDDKTQIPTLECEGPIE